MAISLTRKQRSGSVSFLQARAWTIANTSYRASGGAAYRAYARELYDEDLHERITALFAKLDQQNAQVDAALMAGKGERTSRSPQAGGSAVVTTGTLSKAGDERAAAGREGRL
jgi:hypothetical protein